MGLCSLGVNTASRVILFNGVCPSSCSYWENLLRCSVLGFCNPWLTSIPTPAHQAQSECLLNLDEGKAHIYLLSFWDSLIKGTAAVLSQISWGKGTQICLLQTGEKPPPLFAHFQVLRVMQGSSAFFIWAGRSQLCSPRSLHRQDRQLKV